uniref:Globin domain-containing protein n=1 Tax=Neolamprologus brichardi TaxID=32507 RepID=A0A3Q4HN30_NEOBR
MVEWTGAELSAITYLWGKSYGAEIGAQALSRKDCDGWPTPKLSVMHSEKLHVDPDNFRVLSEIVAFCVASTSGPQVFAPGVQMTWQTFLAVVVSALGKHSGGTCQRRGGLRE